MISIIMVILMMKLKWSNLFESILFRLLSPNPIWKKTIKIDLAYYLTKRENQAAEECTYWISQFESVLVPFDITDDPRVFWVWVWEVYFPDDDYHLNDLDLYEEDHRPRGYPYEITI